MAKGNSGAWFNLDIEGYNALKKLLDPPETLYTEAWHNGMRTFASRLAEDARGAAPFRSGKLRSTVRAWIQKRPFPQWVKVGARPLRRTNKYPKGYNYARTLAFSDKYHHRNWLYNSVRHTVNDYRPIFQQIHNEIRNKWLRGG